MKEIIEQLKGVEADAQKVIEEAKVKASADVEKAQKDVAKQFDSLKATLEEEREEALAEAEKKVSRESKKIQKKSKYDIEALEEKANNTDDDKLIAKIVLQ